MLAGNTVSFGLSILISIVGSLIFPDDHDFETTKNTGKKAVKQAEQSVVRDQETIVTSQVDDSSEKFDKDDKQETTPAVLKDFNVPDATQGDLSEEDFAHLTKSMKLAAWFAITWTIVMVFIVTFSLYGTSYIFPRAGFKAWVSIGLAWLLLGATYIILSPIYESLPSLIKIFTGIIIDVFTLGNYKKSRSSEKV